jgi:hypothetical protein
VLAVAALSAAAAIAFTVLAVVDDVSVSGADRWLKPWKFAVSIAVYTATVAWMLRLVRTHRRAAGAAALVAALALVGELAIIAVQAARGTTSHFNEDTPLDGALFGAMGGLIVAVWVASLVLALVLLRERVAGAGVVSGLRWGLGIAVAAMLGGMLMIDPLNEWVQAAAGGAPTEGGGAHTVGAADGGPGLPLVGWSTEAGDLRVAHFVGLHALQALPLVGLVLDRRPRLDPSARRGLVRTAGVGWVGLLLVLLVQALRGESLVRPGAVTVAAAGVLVLALGATTVAVLRRSDAGQRPGVTKPLS